MNNYNFPPNWRQLFSLSTLSFTLFLSPECLAKLPLSSILSSCSVMIEASVVLHITANGYGSVSSAWSPSLSPAELIMGSTHSLLPHQHHKLFCSSHSQTWQQAWLDVVWSIHLYHLMNVFVPLCGFVIACRLVKTTQCLDVQFIMSDAHTGCLFGSP